MVLFKVPIIAAPFSYGESIGESGLDLKSFQFFYSPRESFKAALAGYFKNRTIVLTGSGTASLYYLLKALAVVLSRKEVILPAFTSPAIVEAINKAGLSPRLIDVSLETFNLDMDSLSTAITRDTLAIIPVHMFGLACEIEKIKALTEGKDIYLIEDFAQAMGTVLERKEAGTLSNLAFTSFGRGKNLPTYSGGMIVLEDEGMARAVEGLKKEDRTNLLDRFVLFIKLLIFPLVTNRYIYGLLQGGIRAIERSERYCYFSGGDYTDLQAKVGLFILKKFRILKEKRINNGYKLYHGLRGLKGLRLPRLIDGSIPVFNRLPVVFEDLEKKDLIIRELNQQGIEARPLYPQPLHDIYPELNTSFPGDAFPAATYLARHHLCLPTHSQITSKDIDRILTVFKDNL